MFKPEDYVYARPLDWRQIIQDMVDRGLNYSQLSQLMGVSWSTFKRWVEGTEPKESDGRAILELHRRYCGVDLTTKRVDEGEKR